MERNLFNPVKVVATEVTQIDNKVIVPVKVKDAQDMYGRQEYVERAAAVKAVLYVTKCDLEVESFTIEGFWELREDHYWHRTVIVWLMEN
jgi:hypothetical protein